MCTVSYDLPAAGKEVNPDWVMNYILFSVVVKSRLSFELYKLADGQKQV